jgi:hypothetical protein
MKPFIVSALSFDGRSFDKSHSPLCCVAVTNFVSTSKAGMRCCVCPILCSGGADEDVDGGRAAGRVKSGRLGARAGGGGSSVASTATLDSERMHWQGARRSVKVAAPTVMAAVDTHPSIAVDSASHPAGHHYSSKNRVDFCCSFTVDDDDSGVRPLDYHDAVLLLLLTL